MSACRRVSVHATTQTMETCAVRGITAWERPPLFARGRHARLGGIMVVVEEGRDKGRDKGRGNGGLGMDIDYFMIFFWYSTFWSFSEWKNGHLFPLLHCPFSRRMHPGRGQSSHSFSLHLRGSFPFVCHLYRGTFGEVMVKGACVLSRPLFLFSLGRA